MDLPCLHLSPNCFARLPASRSISLTTSLRRKYMPLFHYQALDVNGQLVSGDLETVDVQSAVGELHARGLAVQSIGLAITQPLPPTPPSASSASRIQPPRQRLPGESVELAVLRSHMAVILDRGRPIAPALRAYAEEMPSG